MRKFYLSVLITLFAIVTKAQCDTINMPVPQSWSDTFYYAPSPFPGFPGGYINGVNASSGGDLQKANYFDLSLTSYSYILGAIVKFGKANPSKLIDTSLSVYFKVYADNSGTPGSLLVNDSTTLGHIRRDVSLGQNTVINFPATALPSSKKFYVSVDVSNLLWSLGGSRRDSLWIGSTKDDQTANIAWEFEADSSWHPFSDSWTSDSLGNNPMDVTLWIFPYVSVSASGCGLLPVKLLSFDASPKNSDVVVNWQVSTEMNMKGYEVERANNNGVYTSVIFVPAFNNFKNQNYSFIDRNAFANSSTLQYRLKQIDGDGRVQYSRIVTVKSNENTHVTFANPFTGELKLRLTLNLTQTVSINIYDIQGRLVSAEKPLSYGAASSIVTLHGTGNLKAGTYILQLNAGTEHYTYKIVKQ